MGRASSVVTTTTTGLAQRLSPHAYFGGSAKNFCVITPAFGGSAGFHISIAASKGAVEGLVRTLAAEWAPDIRVNAVAPSLTDTSLAASLLGNDAKREAAADRHPLKKVLGADEVASAAAYLVSEHAAGITGQVMQVDAGMGAVR